jgi:hypothetical protein
MEGDSPYVLQAGFPSDADLEDLMAAMEQVVETHIGENAGAENPLGHPPPNRGGSYEQSVP